MTVMLVYIASGVSRKPRLYATFQLKGEKKAFYVLGGSVTKSFQMRK
jgi:hypothetical protein